MIAGAGPAGSAAAVAACRAGARVLLLDRADFPRDKPCGDGIAAEAVDVLAGLGVHGITDGYPEIPRLRLTAPGGATVARELVRPAHTVPRRVLDERLVRAAVAAGAQLRRHTIRRLTVRGRTIRPAGPMIAGPLDAGPLGAEPFDVGPFDVGPLDVGRASFEAGGVEVDGLFRGRVLIGADGAESIVRRALGFAPNPPGHRAVAIRGYRPTANLHEQVIVTTRQRWPAYAWEFPLGDGTANVGYGEVLRGVALSRAYLRERLSDLLPGAEPTGLRGHHLPLSTRRPPAGAGAVLLAGDALSLINPFTGEGIFYAVLSGALAGDSAALGPDEALRRYRERLRLRLGRHLRHSRYASSLTRWPTLVDATVRAAARDAVVFGRMVDLGLGDGVFDLRTIGRIAVQLPRLHPAAP